MPTNRDPLEEVMTAKEAADLLPISEHAVYKARERGQIEGRKSGQTWLFRRVDIVARWGDKEHKP